MEFFWKKQFLFLTVILLVWFIDNAHSQDNQCLYKKIRIMDDFYTMSTLLTFPRESLSAVAFGQMGNIKYVLNDVLFQYDEQTLKSEPIPGYIFENDEGSVMCNENMQFVLQSINSNERVAKVDLKNESIIKASSRGDLALFIKYEKDKIKMGGKLFTVNTKDLKNIGTFVPTQWIREVGSGVIDISIDSITGNIVIAVNRDYGGELIYMQRNNGPYNSELQNILRDMFLNASRHFEVDQNCYDVNEKKMELVRKKNQLEIILKKLQNLDKEYADYIDLSMDNSINVTIKSKRSATNDDILACTSKIVFKNQKFLLENAANISESMISVVNTISTKFEAMRNETIRNESTKHRIGVNGLYGWRKHYSGRYIGKK